MKLWKWLYPGLRVKRWLLLFSLGVFLLGYGLAGFLVWLVPEWLLGAPRVLLYRVTDAGPILSAAFTLLGLGLSLFSLGRIVTSVALALVPEGHGPWASQVLRRRRLERGPRIVTVGGGTGLSVLLRGLKRYTRNITAVVTVADDGGSSGVLRGEMGILPPGDIRNCLVALADAEPAMAQLFQHRLRSGHLKGHSLGNLFIGAMTEMSGDFQEAIRLSSQVLAVRGRVVPATLSPVSLRAFMEDGRVVEGESQIPRAQGKIKRVELVSEGGAEPRPVPEALESIEQADMIVLGPGSLYTSIIPNLLVNQLRESITGSEALKVYVCNLMTQPGETDGFSASDHARVLLEISPGLFDVVVVNTGPVPPSYRDRYGAKGAVPVLPDVRKLRGLGVEVVGENLLDGGQVIRHRQDLLARLLMELYAESDREARPRRYLRLYWEELWSDGD